MACSTFEKHFFVPCGNISDHDGLIPVLRDGVKGLGTKFGDVSSALTRIRYNTHVAYVNERIIVGGACKE